MTNTALYLDVNRLAEQSGWAHGMMRVIATDGVGLFALLVLAAWWIARRHDNAPRGVAAAVWAAAATVAAVGINQLIAKAVREPRPYARLHHVEVLVGRSHDFSFPSDHAVTAGAAAAGVLVVAHLIGRGARWLAGAGVALALIVAFSRVYVGAHYPGDVLAGLLVGAAVAIGGWLLLGGVLTRLARSVSRVERLRPLVRARRGAELGQPT